jgi:hypothetical protein
MGLGSFHTQRSGGTAVFVVAGALAVGGLAACGEDDNSGEPGADTGTATTQAETGGGTPAKGSDGRGGGRATPESGPALVGDPAQARDALDSVDGVYRDVSAAVEDGVASTDIPARQTLDDAVDNESLGNVCELMSKEAQRQTIVYAKRSAGLADVDWNCENATGLLLRRARQAGGLKRSLQAKVVGVNVEGDRATASLRFGGKGPISTVPMVREDGEWKLAAAPSGGGR